MECQATKTKTEIHRGVLEEANQHLHQLFWCLSVVVLTVQGVGQLSNWKLMFHFKAQIHKSNINCSVGEN